jgi:hypothetical protein
MQKRSALLVLRPHLKSSGNDNNNAQAVFDANNCAECLKYVVHAKKSHDQDIYSFHPEMFDWEKVGSNKWTVSLQLQGDIIMLHNERYHVTCCYASSSHSYLTLHNLFQTNAPKRRCVAALSPFEEKKWCSLANDVDASIVKAVQDSLTPVFFSHFISCVYTCFYFLFACKKKQEKFGLKMGVFFFSLARILVSY